MTASTPRFCTRLRYSATCLVLPPLSSMKSAVTVAPAKPLESYGAGSLPALIASTTISAPFRAGTPNGPAAGPDRNAGTAIVTLSFAVAGAATAIAAATDTPASPIQVLVVISVPFPVVRHREI